MRFTFIFFLLVFLSFLNTVHAQKKTREAFQHPKLGAVTLVKKYKEYTNTIDFEYFEKTVTVSDPTFGEMRAVNEYDQDGDLFWQSRYKENYNDPKLGIVNIEQEFDEGEIYTDYRIRKNHKDPELGIVDVVMSFLDEELETSYKIKSLKKEDPSLGIVNTTIVYEDDIKDSETITYGSTTIEKSFYGGKLTTKKKKYLDENNDRRYEEWEYSSGGFPNQVSYYKNGKRHGVQKYFRSKGELQREISYQDGVKFGIQNSYHFNGKLEETETINENGNLDENYSKYDYSGDLEIKGSYADGKKVGTWEHYSKYHEPNLIKKCVYDTNMTVCEEVDYYDHGGHFTAKSFATYVQNADDYYREGAFTEYYNFEKKLIKEQGAYKNGEQFGPWVSKDVNGNITCSVTYLENNQIKDQKFAYYSDEGIKISDGSNAPDYSCGGKVAYKGEGYKNRFNDGKPSSEEIYFDGELVADKLYKHGVLSFERKFENNERVAVTAYDKKGRISYKWKVIDDATFIEQFNYKANIYDSGFIHENEIAPKVLERTVTYDTGEVRAKGNVIAAPKTDEFLEPLHPYLKMGVWKTYYKNGNLETVGKYENGQPVGLWVKYDENGNVLEEIQR